MITTNGFDNSSVATSAVVSKLPVIADSQGRLRVTAEQRREILAAFAQSQESLPQFARRIGLKYSTLARWVQANPVKPARRSPRLRLCEAVLEAPPADAAGPLLLQFPGGVRLEVAGERQVALAAKLVQALAGPC